VSKVTVRDTTPDDGWFFEGGEIPCPVMGLTAEVDGRIIGIGGICYLPNGVVGVFGEFTDELRRHKVTLLKNGFRIMAALRSQGVQEAIATCGPDDVVAQRWLERLGFVDTRDLAMDRKLYRWSIS
jgi:hypothetical protein